MLAALALTCAALALGRGGRAGVMVAVAGVAIASGVGLAWWRAERVASPVLARPAIVRFRARVERVEPLPARELVRVRLMPVAVLPGDDGQPARTTTLPPIVRVNIAGADVPAGLARGAVIEIGARLMPPNPAGVPGAYDFARAAWFLRLGATGRATPPVRVVTPGAVTDDGVRARLTRHIEAQLPGSVGGVAAAFVTGDVGAIGLADTVAMQRAGLAHLLSISGLHISAAVAATMLLVTRLLALWPWFALRVRVPLVAGAAAALAALGYTWLSGAEVPTIRSCAAALLVLAALALGREALTLRSVAVGAFVVLVAWPESLVGPSFQLSFAAVAAIVALHEHPAVKGWVSPREEARWRRLFREVASLVGTGLVVEIALLPIAVYHFHKEGLYGAFANIVAIPLSTFAIMPAEALALALDLVGLGAPFWWLTGRAIALLLWLARRTATAPGAVAMLPGMPDGAFVLMVAGGIWVTLWRTRVRWAGLVPFALGGIWALLTPAPDLIVTGDGQHVAMRVAGGDLAILRDRSGDYTRDMLAVTGGIDGEPMLLDEQREARCSRDLCLVARVAGGRQWRVLATRSGYPIDAVELTAACAGADVVVSDRRLPRGCRPRWLRLDPATLARTGGVTVNFASGRIAMVRLAGDEHPWATGSIVAGGAFQRTNRYLNGGRSRFPQPRSSPW